MYDLFQEGRMGNALDHFGLRKIVQKYSSNTVSDEQIDQAFKVVSRGADTISYQEFEKGFSWVKPAGGAWETRCFRAIREWMFKNQLSSETAFEALLTKADKLIQKRLTRVDLHSAFA